MILLSVAIGGDDETSLNVTLSTDGGFQSCDSWNEKRKKAETQLGMMRLLAISV